MITVEGLKVANLLALNSSHQGLSQDPSYLSFGQVVS